MLPYILVFSIIFSMSLVFDLFSNKILKIFSLLIILLSITYLYFFRDYSVGKDTYEYVRFFSEIINLNHIGDVIAYSQNNNIEYGFALIIYLFSFLTYPPAFFAFFAFISYFNLLVFACYLRVNLTLYILLFFSVSNYFLTSFNILRQNIALSFVILSLIYLFKEKKGIFVFFVFIASFFHYTSLVALFFLPIYYYRERLYNKSYYLMILFFFTYYLIMNFVLMRLDKYLFYLESDSVTNKLSWFLVFFHILIYIISVIFLKLKGIIKDQMKFFLIINSIFLGFLMAYQLFEITNQGIFRVLYYFMWASNLCLLYLLSLFCLKNRIILNILVFLILIIYQIYLIIYSGQNFYPYQYNAMLSFL